MELVNQLFLDALKASLEGREVNWSSKDKVNIESNGESMATENVNLEVSVDHIMTLLEMAKVHNILPMIYQAIYSAPVFGLLDPQYQRMLRRDVFQCVAMQAKKTSEFLLLYDYLRQGGFKPCVVKGIICRELYPHPDDRMSGDEDIFISAKEFKRIHESMLAYGMVLANPEEDIEKVYEVPYGKMGSPLYIEMHKHLFSTESEAYGDLNRFFDGIHNRTEYLHKGECGLIEEEIQGTKFLTLNHTDHLFYLICHSFKHFLHSGFGIRQVCDIILYANAHGVDVDWEYVLERCCEIRADLFAAAIFKIGEKYLTFDRAKACYPHVWSDIYVDESDMLDDLLAAGVYGQSDMSRKHSSNMTLDAVIADKRGRKAKVSLLSSLFPSRNYLEGRFPYLKKYPFLLPLAWGQRVWKYKKETSGGQQSNSAVESIKIGTQRIELMKKYGIIK